MGVFDLSAKLEPRTVTLDEAEYVIKRPTVDQEITWSRDVLRQFAAGNSEQAYENLVKWFSDVAPEIPANELPGKLLIQLGQWLIADDPDDVTVGNASGATD